MKTRPTLRMAMDVPLKKFHSDHRRTWRDNFYVYPVISRRSRGLSIGVNLNPDKACNFDCIYCQVDRSTPGPTKKVDLTILETELDHMISMAESGELFEDAHFGHVPEKLRRLNDIAFSGDGEPTTCPQFGEAVEVAIRLKEKHDLGGAKLILITDACYLRKPKVREALALMDDHQGEIWTKLDAGTQDYYELVNQPNYPLSHVLANITAIAKVRPVVIQSLFMRVHGEPPPEGEVESFCGRLNDIVAAGGGISLVQIYTVARKPAQGHVTALSNEELNTVAQRVRDQTALPVEAFD